MITLEEAKAILKDDTMSDEEIYAVIKELQLLVELAFDNEIELKTKLKNLSQQNI